MADKSAIKIHASETFYFSAEEIAQILIAYNLPSWPKSLKRTKLEWLQSVISNKLEWIIHFGCVDQDIENLSNLLVHKCLYSCDIAKYAQRIPLIGRLITMGKFPVVLNAMKNATVEYVYSRSTWHSADESLNLATYTYWQELQDTLSDWLF